MVHATWCQSLGRSSFESIPRWFHEGMAQWYENQGWRQFPDRAMNRGAVWMDRGNLLLGAGSAATHQEAVLPKSNSYMEPLGNSSDHWDRSTGSEVSMRW